jgi:hypothetical protein
MNWIKFLIQLLRELKEYFNINKDPENNKIRTLGDILVELLVALVMIIITFFSLLLLLKIFYFLFLR